MKAYFHMKTHLMAKTDMRLLVVVLYNRYYKEFTHFTLGNSLQNSL